MNFNFACHLCVKIQKLTCLYVILKKTFDVKKCAFSYLFQNIEGPPQAVLLKNREDKPHSGNPVSLYTAMRGVSEE